MNVLFRSPLGALLAKPWVDQAGLFGLRRWYRPLSRLWAAANHAGTDTALFRAQTDALPAFWTDVRLRRLLGCNERRRQAAEATRMRWEAGIFDDRDVADPRTLDDRRRGAATRHLMTRAAFYPLLFPRPPSAIPWQIDPPDGVSMPDAATLYEVPLDAGSIAMSRPFERNGVREFWLRAPTPSAPLRARRGSETMYARVVEPVEPAAPETLIIGSGLCLEFELLPVAHDPGKRLAAMGWRVIQPISPYHGLRAMPGFYGGEPFFALAPTGALDLIAGQALETGLLTAWARRRYGGRIAVGGISMSSFVAQQVASHCRLWPAEARPDAVLLISHSGRIEDVTFGGELAASFGIDRALREAGWSRAALALLSSAIDPAEAPALAPSRIVSVLGETDRWVPYGDGLAVARGWQLPEANIFRYPLGHLGMPVQLARDPAPFERLRQVLREA
ncbi:MAG: hypothetical protein KIS73_01785 [Enhydrobacter sp.]|nr:hypothetical protein [Enhydrobacter sp.]